jgi:hypothetical protein
MIRQRSLYDQRQRHDPVYSPFATSHADLAAMEVHVLDPQAQTLEQP